MDISLRRKKEKKAKFKGEAPSKRHINFIEANKKPKNKRLRLLLALLALVVLAAVAKFDIYDRMSGIKAAESEIERLEAEQAENLKKIADLENLSERYAHYTKGGMTDEELSAADRVAAMQLIDERVLPYAGVEAWSINGNRLIVRLTGSDLQTINRIAQSLLSDELVELCTVSTAARDSESTVVLGDLIIELKKQEINREVLKR